jgi:3-hydroxyisobutyrate dehydrogenase-like beta-hydroxyacid dehydrogenase
VYGNNRTASKAQPLIERGLLWRDTPREVAAAADVVFSMVADDAALEAITPGLRQHPAGREWNTRDHGRR